MGRSVARNSWAALAAAVVMAACGGGGGGGGGGDSGPAPEAPQADYFPLSAGDGWSYANDDGTTSTTRVIASVQLGGQPAFQVRTLDSAGSSDEYYRKTASAVTIVPGSDADALSAALGPVTLMKLPLRQGDRFSAVDGNADGILDLDGDGRPDKLAIKGDVTVVEIGPLTTSAGTLANTAHLRTIVTETATSSLTGRQIVITLTSDDWYAPGIGLVRNTTSAKSSGVPDSASSQDIRQYHVGPQRSATAAALVASTSPAESSTGATAVVKVVFGEDMDTLKTEALGLTLSDGNGQAVAGQAVWDDRRTLRFQPAQALASGSYRVQLGAGAENLAGNSVSTPRSWTFRLDKDGPVLVGITPADGAASLPLDTPVRIAFDEPVDLASARDRISLQDVAGIGAVDVTMTLDGSTVVLQPKAPLRQRASYRVSVGSGIADGLGNAGTATASSTFTTDPGWFSLAQTAPGLAGVSLSRGSVAADFNGDGRVDVAVATAGGLGMAGSGIRVLPGSGDGSFGTPVDFPDAQSSSHDLFAIDLDGDGRAELLSIGSSGLQQWHWNADGSVSTRAMPAVPSNYALVDGATVRIAADQQRVALLATDLLGGRRMLWRQSAPGVFGAAVDLPASNSAYQRLAFVGDVNGDGRDDLVFTGYQPGDMRVLLQQADGSFSPGAPIANLPASGFYQWIDVNGDGRSDIVYLDDSGARPLAIAVLLQQADGSFATGPSLPIGCAGCGISGLKAADLDGDGRTDFVAMAHGGAVFLMRQASDGSFGTPDQFSAGSASGDLLLADLNGDGRQDLIAASSVLLQRAVARPGGSTALRAKALLTQPRGSRR